MEHPRFSLCVRLASKMLLASDAITTFPVDPQQLNLGQSIIIRSIQYYCKSIGMELNKSIAAFCEDGLVVRSIKRGVNIILYNEDINNVSRVNWTLAHEIGHIVLNHSDNISNATQEIEAHYFAANLLMPTPIIAELIRKGILVDEDTLRYLFGVSQEAASKKMETLRKWGEYRQTKYDAALIHKFKDFIDSFSRPLYILDGNLASYLQRE